MKYRLILALTGVCLLLTGCAEKNAETAETQNLQSTAQNENVESIQQNIPEIVTEENTVPEIPAVPSSPEAIIGIWKNPQSNHAYWFQENNSYVTMICMGTFPEDIPIEMTETSLTLTLDGEPVSLTQTGTHVFDTLDGLYNAEGKAYQVLIMGNIVYIYNNLNLIYEYNGELLKLTDSEINCYISGDTAQIGDQTFIRTHDFDDFLLN
ncbi:MAG: hypothetical protein IJ642_00460 [Oscillospiraceae bacterium]|nr:hypothetical protein [Oscillospiraceae bacterium]